MTVAITTATTTTTTVTATTTTLQQRAHRSVLQRRVWTVGDVRWPGRRQLALWDTLRRSDRGRAPPRTCPRTRRRSIVGQRGRAASRVDGSRSRFLQPRPPPPPQQQSVTGGLPPQLQRQGRRVRSPAPELRRGQGMGWTAAEARARCRPAWASLSRRQQRRRPRLDSGPSTAHRCTASADTSGGCGGPQGTVGEHTRRASSATRTQGGATARGSAPYLAK